MRPNRTRLFRSLTLLFALVLALVGGGSGRAAMRANKRELVARSRDRMSSAGRFATRARTAVRQGTPLFARAATGFKLASADDGDGEEKEQDCINGPECESEGDGPAGGQAEVSIAVDASGQHVVIGYNDTRGFALNPISVSGVQYSDDGGQTFVDGGQLPTPGADVDWRRRNTRRSSATLKSSTWAAALSSTPRSWSRSSRPTAVAQTMWRPPLDRLRPHLGRALRGDAGHQPQRALVERRARRRRGQGVHGRRPRDRPRHPELVELHARRHRRRRDLRRPTRTTSDRDAAHLVHRVRSWAPTEPDGQGSVPRFAGNGSNDAYVVLAPFPFPGTFGGLGNSIGFARSTDNGATWSAPVNLTPEFFTMDQVLGNDRINTIPSMAVDNSGGRLPRQRVRRLRQQQQPGRRRHRLSKEHGRRR